MTINVKRLAVDAGYWDSVAPGGATHFFPPSGDWYKDSEPGLQSWATGPGFWVPAGYPDRLKDRRAIPRPQPQPEWVDGLPGVGVECEVRYAGYWVEAITVHLTITGDLVCEMRGDFLGRVRIIDKPELVRPIRTPEQRQRDELIGTIKGDLDTLDMENAEQIAGCIAIGLINRGWRKGEPS